MIEHCPQCGSNDLLHTSVQHQEYFYLVDVICTDCGHEYQEDNVTHDMLMRWIEGD